MEKRRAQTWEEVMREIDLPDRDWADIGNALLVLLAVVRQTEANRLAIKELTREFRERNLPP